MDEMQTTPVREAPVSDEAREAARQKALERRRRAELRARRAFAQRRRLHNVLLTGLFFLTILIFFLANLFVKDKPFSDAENRNLAQKPALSRAALADGSWFDGLTDWYNDQFFARDGWISLNLWENARLGRKEAGGVYLGQDHYLIAAPEVPNEAALTRTLNAVNQFSNDHPDIATRLLLVPDAAAILADHLPKNAPVRDQLVRSLVCYVREDGKRKGALEKLIGRSELLSFLQVSEDEIEKLTAAEDAFQEHVTGGTMALGELRSKIGGEVIKPAELQTDAEKAAHLKKIHDEQVAKEKEERRRAREAVAVQVFFDTGKGYSEEESFIVDHDYETEGVNAFTIQVPANVKRLRIDPARVPCICLLRRADIDGNPSLMQNPKYRRVTPASSLGEGGAITFLDCDPWLDFDMVKIRKKLKDKDPQKANTVSLAIQIAGIPGTMADMVLSRRKRDR